MQAGTNEPPLEATADLSVAVEQECFGELDLTITAAAGRPGSWNVRKQHAGQDSSVSAEISFTRANVRTSTR